MQSQTEYETTRRTVVKRTERAAPRINPWPNPQEADPDDARTLGFPGCAKGTITLYSPVNGWVLLDACVPVEVARMIEAAYECLSLS